MHKSSGSVHVLANSCCSVRAQVVRTPTQQRRARVQYSIAWLCQWLMRLPLRLRLRLRLRLCHCTAAAAQRGSFCVGWQRWCGPCGAGSGSARAR